MPDLSLRCPYCFGRMRVAALHCEDCHTEIRGSFVAPRFLELSLEQQQFAMDFILADGSLKDLAAKYGISYPTVRSRLDRLVECLQAKEQGEERRRAAILDAVQEKRISAQEASRLLGGPRQKDMADNEEGDNVG